MIVRVHLAVYDENPLNKRMTVCYAEVNAEIPDGMTTDEYARRLVVNLSVQAPDDPEQDSAMHSLSVPAEPEPEPEPEPGQLPVLPDDLPPEDEPAPEPEPESPPEATTLPA